MARTSSFLAYAFLTVLITTILNSDATPTPAEGKECPSICPANYAPVCGAKGSEQKTFSNRCAFNSQNCNSPGWAIINEKGQC